MPQPEHAAEARSSGPPRAVALTFFLIVFATYAYFYQGGGPNQFSRYGLTAALVDHGRVDIDDYHHLTFDKAEKDGHYYCDKAPGLSFLAAPLYALCRPLIAQWAVPESRAWLNSSLYVITLLAVSLPVALAMTSFYWRAWREAGPRAAFWVSVALALGSPLAVYASLFYAHALCGALLWLAFTLLTGSAQEEVPTTAHTAMAGFLAGWAVVSEFPVVLIAGLLYAHLGLRGRGFWRPAAAFVLAGLPLAGVLLAYNVAA